jgi:hypothetical protein
MPFRTKMDFVKLITNMKPAVSTFLLFNFGVVVDFYEVMKVKSKLLFKHVEVLIRCSTCSSIELC